MKTLKTQKGTELPLLNLKGKDYLSVQYRVLWWREVFPLGRIDTQLLEKTDKYVVYTATVSVPNDKGEYVKLADALKREDYAHFADANEKAQTGAIGRALGLCGFGTQFAHELSEDDRIVDSPLEKKTETKELKKEKEPTQEISESEKKTLWGIMKGECGWDNDFILKTFKDVTKKENSKDWSREDYNNLLNFIQTNKPKVPVNLNGKLSPVISAKEVAAMGRADDLL